MDYLVESLEFVYLPCIAQVNFRDFWGLLKSSGMQMTHEI